MSPNVIGVLLPTVHPPSIRLRPDISHVRHHRSNSPARIEALCTVRTLTGCSRLSPDVSGPATADTSTPEAVRSRKNSAAVSPARWDYPGTNGHGGCNTEFRLSIFPVCPMPAYTITIWAVTIFRRRRQARVRRVRRSRDRAAHSPAPRRFRCNSRPRSPDRVSCAACR